jgi:DNA-binding FrmR family transcriptional regulator
MAGHKHASPHSIEVQKSMVNRLSRVEGQIRGIKKLIENETYCDDILHQLEAARSALRSIELVLLESHVKHCVVRQIQEGDPTITDEIMTTFKKIAK